MPVCPVDNSGWCERHQRQHVGAILELALRDDEQGERIRRIWDNRPAPGAKPCACRRDTIVINQGAQGLGDGLHGLFAVAAIKQANPNKHVIYKVGPKAMPFLRLFTGFDELREADYDVAGTKTPTTTDRQLNLGYVEEVAGKGTGSRLERYLRNLGVAEAVVPSLRYPEAIRDKGKDFAGCIALCPFSDGSDREYSLQGWLTVEDLLAKAGYRPVVLGNNLARAAAHHGEQVINVPAERTAGIIVNAACCIGVDSGLTHLCSALGRPTIALMAQSKDVFTGYPAVRELHGPLDCAGCWWQPPWTQSCRPHCPALQAITPQRILAEVDNVVLPTITQGRSLLTVDRLAVLRDSVLATNHLEGDVAELGVYRGGSAKVLRHYAKGTVRLFDTFTGLPTDDVFGEHKEGDFASDLEEVQGFLSDAIFHVGVFPHSAPEQAKYRMVHVDCDTYQSCVAALAYFVPRMMNGGIMIVDDYGGPGCSGIAKALKESAFNVETSAQFQGRIRFSK